MTARFISEDTYRGQANDPLSLNLYTYCANSPIKYIDPSGHEYAQLGDKGNNVGQVQNALQTIGFKVSVTGIFTDNTESGLKSFQASVGLKPTGVADSSTMQALMIAYGKKINENKNNKSSSQQSGGGGSQTNNPPINSHKDTDDPIISNEDMVSNLLNDKTLGLDKAQKEAVASVASAMLDEGYEPAFVAGVVANLIAEGATAGDFESSNYKKKTPPPYIVALNNNTNYKAVFSNNNISDSNIGISKTLDLLNKINDYNKNNGKKDADAMFGLGIAQWTGVRTERLLEYYVKAFGKNGHPTYEQCVQVETQFLLDEFAGRYSDVYEDWQSEYGNNSENAANYAGYIVCQDYEICRDENSKYGRGEDAENVYNIMMGNK